jgi:hypothetical protein
MVSTINPGNGRVQISNNHGQINGWTSQAKVSGYAPVLMEFPSPCGRKAPGNLGASGVQDISLQSALVCREQGVVSRFS